MKLNKEMIYLSLPIVLWFFQNLQQVGLSGVHRNHNETLVRDQSISKR
jgi:hypothetical protein